uniref:Nucelotide kinase n=1 Tax=Siphoviridae sp. ctKcB20 TaxID=2827568 RepID=A0A8S5LKU1_9CAUD|nr:MAG TPA: nucelotide kinase [Siphoviridae sp. ctKcB20]
MTRDEKAQALYDFCDNKTFNCTDCPLSKKYDKEIDEYTDTYACIFDEMSDDMLNKCYNWYKELVPVACENTENECNDVEPDVDMVNHPSHYNQGGIECIDALKAATVSKTGIEAVCTANAIKYLWRYEEKNGIEDVKKARWYIDRLIKELEEK